MFGPALRSLLSHRIFFLYLFSLLVALILGWEIRADEAARVISVSEPLKVKHCDVVLTWGVAVRDDTNAEPRRVLLV